MHRLRPADLTILLLMIATPASAQLGPFPAIPTAPPHVEPEHHRIVIPNRPDPIPVILHLSPDGSIDGDGSAEHPFVSFEQAQKAVRQFSQSHDVTVQIASGTYPLTAPLRFTADDGGQHGFTVRWEGASGSYPALSGGVTVSGWTLADPELGIWQARIPQGTNPRQLSVNGRLAQRARVEIPRNAVEFHPWGLLIKDDQWKTLAALPDQRRIEVEGMSWFTHRHAMVERIEADRIIMQQPGWRNNLIGYDTFARPVSADVARMFLVNALAFLREPGQWYADPRAGTLYYKPHAGEDMRQAEIVLPRLEYLISIAGTYDRPVRDLQFRGLSFQHTSWLQPSGPEGYASQQSGAYLAGEISDYPTNPIRDCSWGCPAFEARRNHWSQQPAAVQIAAATRIVFDDNHFGQLGQVALGIGNNADANESGIGLGTSAIEVTDNEFADLAGGAIMVGGIEPNAHHPTLPVMGLRDILIRNNRITNISHDYKEQSAILVTYASGTLILNNNVSDTPYDGIDVGWGWGANDPGGSAEYWRQQRSYYDMPGNHVYDTPTTLRDTVIMGNRVSRVKQWFPDGGAIYHLSADPDSLIAENYISDVKGSGGIAIYLDEGSRYVTVRDNVIDDVGGVWLNLNSQDHIAPKRTAMDNLATGNWYNSGRLQGNWTDYLNNRAFDNVAVEGAAWPEKARKIIERSGIRNEEAKP
ncbi:right-handed parallel beta-helix repeat-containing protein [Altererythrobacter indicus]|uniref:Right-handed parallel beta-helix repeat-containing protein n=1 Tax=Altericroceibacterium indicum TaxID=374177 RepID=A0A845A854_9SPHN|nr:right-handed parallel beta-helix repeat-containing protein [Altericroceibacterium indicum]MXP25423.1 right-handed parallel beta-helix repeat-containing protein [Altericroceibacterium indicum]